MAIGQRAKIGKISGHLPLLVNKIAIALLPKQGSSAALGLLA
jgi:hypothetical protein